MTRPLKSVLLGLGVLLAAAVLIAVVAAIYLTVNARPRVEAFAADALGFEVRIGGSLHISLIPSAHLAVTDVHLGNHGKEFASAREADLGIELLSARRYTARIATLSLQGLRLDLQRDRSGRLNVEQSDHSNEPRPDVTVDHVSVAEGLLHYTDERTGNGFEARQCDLDLRQLRIPAGSREDWMKRLSFAAKLACRQFQVLDFAATDLRFSVEGASGVLDFDPVALRVFSGNGTGSVRADLSRSVPFYQVRYQLAAFRIEEFFARMAPKPVGQGTMTFTTNISMHGVTVDEMTRAMSGRASLHGEQLALAMGDLDKKFARFESSQNFNLVDAGAFFFAGPIGLGITKGYDFARIFKGADGSTPVQNLVSEWRLERGIAHATDVAMATKENRVALHGQLDFVKGEFVDVTVALIDAKGCAEAEQKVRGSFRKPEIANPSVLKVLTGPTRRLVGKATSLFGAKCEPFYSGSVAPPK